MSKKWRADDPNVSSVVNVIQNVEGIDRDRQRLLMFFGFREREVMIQ